MARITAYEATDGSIHRDRRDYLRHESNLVVLKKVQAVLAAKVADPVVAAQFVAILTNQVGLNTLREFFAVPFKPGADDGESDTPVATPAPAPVDASTPSAAEPEPAPATPEAAPVKAAEPADI